MTVIQTVVGGTGGSGRVIDARDVTLASFDGSGVSSSTVVLAPYLNGGYDMEIKLGDDTIQVINYRAGKHSGGYFCSKDAVGVIDAVKAGIENLLPDLPDGTYRIITTGCGTTGTLQPYWVLAVNNGVYSLSYSPGGEGLYSSVKPIPVKLISIAKIA